MADRPLITIEHLEKSIESLETRNAFQDDIIEQLNKELSIHQEEIEPPPPHY